MRRRQAQATRDLAKVERIKAKAAKKQAKARLKKPEAVKFSSGNLEKEILREARALNISAETVEKYAEKVAKKVDKWVKARAEVTKNDINQQVAKEIERYNKDLAFVYRNRGKII